jgi:hypothetical protein
MFTYSGVRDVSFYECWNTVQEEPYIPNWSAPQDQLLHRIYWFADFTIPSNRFRALPPTVWWSINAVVDRLNYFDLMSDMSEPLPYDCRFTYNYDGIAVLLMDRRSGSHSFLLDHDLELHPNLLFMKLRSDYDVSVSLSSPALDLPCDSVDTMTSSTTLCPRSYLSS